MNIPRLARLAHLAALQRQVAQGEVAHARSAVEAAAAEERRWEAAWRAAGSPLGGAGLAQPLQRVWRAGWLGPALGRAAAEAAAARQRAEAAAEEARQRLLERRREEEALRRLLARRREAAAREALRREQALLDEMGQRREVG